MEKGKTRESPGGFVGKWGGEGSTEQIRPGKGLTVKKATGIVSGERKAKKK